MFLYKHPDHLSKLGWNYPAGFFVYLGIAKMTESRQFLGLAIDKSKSQKRFERYERNIKPKILSVSQAFLTARFITYMPLIMIRIMPDAL